MATKQIEITGWSFDWSTGRAHATITDAEGYTRAACSKRYALEEPAMPISENGRLHINGAVGGTPGCSACAKKVAA